MKRMLNKISILLIVMMIATGAAFAAEASVTYEGGAEEFVFLPGSEYTETDLFDNFKGVMPGDEIDQKIIVKNDTKDCDYVKIFMRGEAHGDDNALSESVAEEETVVSMKDFLKQLDMTVLKDGKVIFEGSGSELEGFEESVLLGEFRRGDEVELTVRLSAPIELGNKYANRVGEVDWVFTAEQHNDPVPPTPTPETGDSTNLMLYGGMLAAAAVLLALMAKRRRHN
ncbi:MAG: LPXTG cell wall anchor domain-containing protein [Firmicutes bacterium]|nr:LPXTG cell wall anchor domain-containing protein [Bacillota bacterium]